MSDFTELELNDEVADMTEEEAKTTLTDFMAAHQENRAAYDALASEVEEVETEYSEKLESKEELISDFKEDRAEKAAEYANLPADTLAERFSFEEIEQIIEEGEEYSEDDTSDDDPDEPILTFTEKPEKGRADSGVPEYRERAKEKLSQHGFPIAE